MITLHYLQCSRSFRILWALEELGMDYQVEYYQRTSSYAAPENLKNIHPLGKAPIRSPIVTGKQIGRAHV